MSSNLTLSVHMKTMPSTLSIVDVRARELDGLSQAIIATDAEGQVIYWNDVAERLYGWTSDEAIGRAITDLTPTPMSRDDATRILETLRLGNHWSGAFPVTRKDGSTFVAHVVDAPVRDEDGEIVGIIGISSDASPIVRLQRLARDLSGASTPGAVARVALDAALEFSGAATGSFMILDQERSGLESLHSAGYSADVVERFRRIPLDAPLPIAVAATTGEAMFICSHEEWMSRFPAVIEVTDPRTRAWVALPMTVGDRVVGAIGLSVRIERSFAQPDRDQLVAMSQHAAVAVERALLFRAEQSARQDAETARAKAESANRVKSAFLATMSHELRTPLGAIIGYHDLLADGILGPLNDEQLRHLKRLRNSATHLLTVINEVLSYSRLEAAREMVHRQQGKLGPLMESVAEIVMPLARAKGLDCRVDCTNADVALDTDVQKLKQILVNLAGNAVKYTARGEVTLACAVEGSRLRVTVADTGMGIANEHLDKVFEPFYQVEDADSWRPAGSGLGLSVSRSLAQLLGGDIRVESEQGKGSTFTLEVPLTAP